MTRIVMAIIIGAVALMMGLGTASADTKTPAGQLAPPESFSGITDTQKRSVALFTELGKVLTDARCTNCHPRTDRPRQGDDSHLHQPPVERGADGMGAPAMRCSTCHQNANFDPGRVPGAEHWQLAPLSMAWEGKTVGEICQQIKDPARNGGRTVHDLIDHIGKDTLVGWAWAPGFGRTPAPGTQQIAGALVEAWADTGAFCPAP
jgi:hypothetical protein